MRHETYKLTGTITCNRHVGLVCKPWSTWDNVQWGNKGGISRLGIWYENPCIAPTRGKVCLLNRHLLFQEHIKIKCFIVEPDLCLLCKVFAYIMPSLHYLLWNLPQNYWAFSDYENINVKLLIYPSFKRVFWPSNYPCHLNFSTVIYLFSGNYINLRCEGVVFCLVWFAGDVLIFLLGSNWHSSQNIQI